MTTSENDNLPSGGTDNTHSLSLDDAANIEWDDPSEDTEPDDQEQQSNDEPVEASDEEDQETVEAADDDAPGEDAEQGDDDPDAAEISDDILVPMHDGTPLPLKELKSGYMRQADYTRKTTEVSAKREALENLSNRVQASVEAIAQFLNSSIPPPPNANLAISNPAQYVREKALNDAGMAQVAALIEQANAPKDVLNTLSAEQHKALLETENAKLAEAFPTTATKEGRQKFFEGTARAAKELGFTDEELGRNTDHRLFKLAHYARIGMQAEAAKAKATKKVVGVPPVAPNKRQPGAHANKARQNQDAKKRLARTGSLDDALAVDWD